MSVAKLPSSFRKRNKSTREFRELYARLPARIREATRDACILFHREPSHPSLQLHTLKPTKKGQHQAESKAVYINMQYRAIFVEAPDGTNTWYWIGSHADYDRFTGKI